MKIEMTKTNGDDFPFDQCTDAELLHFSLQLATPCSHCSTKAQIALLSARLLCAEEFRATDDKLFLDPRIILYGAVTALAALDEAEAEEVMHSGIAPDHTKIN